MKGPLTARERILEDLLEAQELQDAEVDAGVEAETAFVWTEGGVELDAEAPVHLHLALVVLPRDSELDHAFGDRGDFEGRLILRVLLEERAVLERGGELCERGLSVCR